MWMKDLFYALPILDRWALGISAVVLFLFFVLGVCLKNTGLYLSGGALVFGGLALAPVFWSKTLIGCVLALFGVGFFMLFSWLGIHSARKRRKAEKAERLRKMKFTLPDKDNEYLRARLNTVLKERKEGEGITRTQADVHPDYAKRLLNGLKNAPVSAVERLETEELGGAISMYFKKERLTEGDLSAVNEAFARLIKLSAKYEIAV